MKYLNFILIIFFFFSLLFCEDTNNINDTVEDPSIKLAELEEKFGKTQSKLKDSPEEIQKRREENDRKFKEKIKKCLKELGLENEKIITKEQLKQLFFKLLDNEEKKEDVKKDGENTEKKAKDLDLIKKFANKIFESLISKDLETIEVEKIPDLFDTKSFLNALKVILKAYGLDSLIDILSGPIMESFGYSFNNKNENSTDSTEKNSTNNKEEKNADL